MISDTTVLKWNQFRQFCFLKEHYCHYLLTVVKFQACMLNSFPHGDWNELISWFIYWKPFPPSYEMWCLMWSDTCLSCAGVMEKWSWRLKLWMTFCTGHNWISSQKLCWWVSDPSRVGKDDRNPAKALQITNMSEINSLILLRRHCYSHTWVIDSGFMVEFQ